MFHFCWWTWPLMKIPSKPWVCRNRCEGMDYCLFLSEERVRQLDPRRSDFLPRLYKLRLPMELVWSQMVEDLISGLLNCLWVVATCTCIICRALHLVLPITPLGRGMIVECVCRYLLPLLLELFQRNSMTWRKSGYSDGVLVSGCWFRQYIANSSYDS